MARGGVIGRQVGQRPRIRWSACERARQTNTGAVRAYIASAIVGTQPLAPSPSSRSQQARSSPLPLSAMKSFSAPLVALAVLVAGVNAQFQINTPSVPSLSPSNLSRPLTRVVPP